MRPPTNYVPRKMLGTLVQRQRIPGGNFDLYQDDTIPEIYADGGSELVAGPFVTKLLLYRQEGADASTTPPTELRRAVATITLPTASIVGLAAFILQTFSQNRAQLVPQIEQLRATLEGIQIEQVRAIEPPEGEEPAT